MAAARRFNYGKVAPSFKAGDLVMLRDHPVGKAGVAFTAKLAPRFQGPFRILEVYKVNTILQHVKLDYEWRAHVVRLKKFCGEAM